MSQPQTPRAALVERVAHPHVPLGAIVAIACVAQFMVVLDTSIVNVALPAMKAGLGLSTTDQQWVVDGYLITFGGFLLLAARAGDLFGRRWVFQAGLVIFTLASLAGGLAQDGDWLIAARFIQGVGAASLAPSSLSLITASHPEGHERHRAMAFWGMAASSAAAVGMVLGGVLTSELSWRYVLFVNVPVGVVLLIAATATLLPSSTNSDRNRLDWPGTLTVTVGVGALVYGISEATSKGWGSTLVIVALAAAAVLLAAFAVIETRSTQPLVPLVIFRHRSLSVANLVMACLGVSMTSTLFFVSLYLQQVLGYTALRTGLALVPMTVLLMIGALVSKRLLPLVGARRQLVAGGLVGAVGVAWLSRFPDHSAYPAHILGPTLVVAAGWSLMVLPVTVAATGGLEARFAGLASGLTNMGRQIGGAIGLAVLVTIAASATRHAHLTVPAAATVHGYRTALVIGAAVSLASALLALLLPRHAQPAPVPATAPPVRTAALNRTSTRTPG